MKKKIPALLVLASAWLLAGCSLTIDTNSGAIHSDEGITSHNDSAKGDGTAEEVSTLSEPTNNGTFSLTTADGTITEASGVYTISSAGTYVASGKLSEGRIVVAAGEEDEVELQLNNATIVSSANSPILATSGSKLKVKAVKETENLIKDTRSAKKTDSDEQGEGAISADIDLTLNGSGTLVVTGSYNNGVHTTKDLTLKNQTLQVTAPNNALKGKNSVTIEEGGTFKIVSTAGDGIKTEDTDVSSKGKQRGSVNITGGTVDITAAYDGIDAAYDVVIANDAELGTTPSVNIASGTYKSPSSKTAGSGWDFNNSSSSSSSDSKKGIKANNEIHFSGGVIDVVSEDDAIHANYGTAFDNGSSGLGNVTISGGTLNIKSGDDGIHADNTVSLAGGTVNVDMAYEAIEANFINMSGGYNTVYAVDDGLNASKKINKTPAVTITGGLLDLAVSNGDCDGIDSNGTYVQSGGTVITRAPGLSGNMNMGALDADGSVQMNGGNLIIFGAYSTISKGSSILSKTWGTTSQEGGGGGGRRWANNSASSISLSSGDYVLHLAEDISFNLSGSCSQMAIFSSKVSSNVTYTLTKGSSTITSFTF